MSASTPKAKSSPLFGALHALYERRWLAAYFVRRDLLQSTKGSFLGILWLLLAPLLMITLYTLIFSKVVGIRFRQVDGVANFGLYLYCGLVPFQAFSGTLNKAVSNIKKNSDLIQKVVFPLEILPASVATTAFITQLFGFAGLIILTVIIEHHLPWTILLLPMIMIPQLIFLLGLAYLVAVIGVYLPDIKDTLRAAVRAAFFITPILWPAELAQKRGLGLITDLNPLAYIVEYYRDLVLEGVIPDGAHLLAFTLFSGALLVGSFLLFVRVKWNFADLV